MLKIPVTVAIPVKNEELILGRCLERLNRFEDIVVIDSASTDGTADIATIHGCNIIQFNWNGRFPKKRNWFLMNYHVRTPWVLFLDADELVNKEFCNAVDTAILSDEYSAFWIKYTNYFMGCRLRYGVPQRKLALLRFGKGLFEHIDEDAWSTLDMEVHEHPIIDGKVGEISELIDHNDDRGIVRFVDRHCDYAQWEARRWIMLKSDRPNHEQYQLTRRQTAKYTMISFWWYPSAYFAYTYFVRLGFLDGRAGLSYAVMKLWYFTTIQALIKDQRQTKRQPR